MATVTRYMVKYRHPYMIPAKYTTSTKFILETDDGERYEYLCGSTYKNYNHFIDVMQKRYGSKLKIDMSKPYVFYQS